MFAPVASEITLYGTAVVVWNIQQFQWKSLLAYFHFVQIIFVRLDGYEELSNLKRRHGGDTTIDHTRCYALLLAMLR